MTKRKDGLWQDTLIINGKKKYFYGKTKAEVKRKMREYCEKEENGKTFEEVADEWWEEHEPKLAYNTAKSYKPAKNRAIESFKEEFIKDITPVKISRKIKEFSLTHAEKTVKTQLLVYNLIGKYAVEMGYILFNPARDLEVPANLPKRKITSPSKADIDRVKKSTNCTFGMFAFWAMYTGMRRGELLALNWEDVDLKKRTIKINKSLYHINNKPNIKLPKTATSIGSVPIMDTLLKQIRKSKGIVFPNEKGEYMTETQFQKQWGLYCEETGISCTPHQLRHAYATMLFEAGIPPEEAQVLLRHAQLSTTMDIYTDLREDKQNSIFEKVYSVDIK